MTIDTNFTSYIVASGAYFDLGQIFDPLNGGTAYGSPTKYRVGVGLTDLNAIFHKSTSTSDRPSYNTGYKINIGGVPTDLSVIFRRYGYTIGPTINVQPTNQTIIQGSTLTFTISATASSGGGSLSYQWWISDDDITFTSLGSSNGAQTATYSKANAQSFTDEKYYYCIVTDSNGSTISNHVYATTNYLPTISYNPVSGTVDLNQTSAFVAQITDGKPTTYTYQWQRSVNNGATWSNLDSTSEVSIGGYLLSNTSLKSSTLSFLSSNPTSGYSYLYRCNVTNAAGSVNSASATLYVRANILSNLSSSVIATIPSGQTSVVQNFSIVAGGSPNFSYQWQKSVNSGASYSNVGTNNPTYSESLTNTSDGYKYRCQVSSDVPSASTVTSSVCTTTVNLIPLSFNAVTTGAVSVTSGNNISFVAANANGSGTLTYQWLVSTNGGLSYSNAGSAGQTYTLTSASSTQNGYLYSCQITSSFSSLGSQFSTPATLTVNSIPTITGGSVTSGPYYFTVNANVANFTVTATGSGTLTYAWYYSTDNSSWGSILSTASNYNLGTVTSPSQTGYYKVIVSNGYGSASSTAYMSVVDVAAAITGGTVYGNPTYNFSDGGSVANFTATATGTNLTYSWSYGTDGVNFSPTGQSGSMSSGSTCQGPIKNPAYIADTGYYRVSITNGAGTVTATAHMIVT